jgi:hypothetical protein
MLVLESTIEPGNAPPRAKFLDLMIWVMNDERERSAEEFRHMFSTAGLRLMRVLSAGEELLIECDQM